MQSRLEEEEEAKAALMSRIQRLTKLILVSSKNSMPVYVGETPSHQRRVSASEDDVSTSDISSSVCLSTLAFFLGRIIVDGVNLLKFTMIIILLKFTFSLFIFFTHCDLL